MVVLLKAVFYKTKVLRIRISLLCGLLLLTGCQSFKSTLGLDHQGPDEFKNISLAPLSLPKNYAKTLSNEKPESSPNEEENQKVIFTEGVASAAESFQAQVLLTGKKSETLENTDSKINVEVIENSVILPKTENKTINTISKTDTITTNLSENSISNSQHLKIKEEVLKKPNSQNNNTEVIPIKEEQEKDTQETDSTLSDQKPLVFELEEYSGKKWQPIYATPVEEPKPQHITTQNYTMVEYVAKKPNLAKKISKKPIKKGRKRKKLVKKKALLKKRKAKTHKKQKKKIIIKK